VVEAAGDVVVATPEGSAAGSSGWSVPCAVVGNGSGTGDITGIVGVTAGCVCVVSCAEFEGAPCCASPSAVVGETELGAACGGASSLPVPLNKVTEATATIVAPATIPATVAALVRNAERSMTLPRLT